MFIVGAPGCERSAVAQAVAEEFGWKFISTGAALRAEAEKKTPAGDRILKCSQSFTFVDDSIVIDVVKKEIEEAEKANCSWIIEGFPKTRVQAHAFAKLGVVPDKLIQLECCEDNSKSKIRDGAKEVNEKLTKKDLDEVAKTYHREWDVHQREVQCGFKQFINFYNCDGNSQQTILNDLVRILSVRFRNGAPRQPPKVVLVGPPGAGCSTQAEIIAEKFGLVCIQPEKLVREEMQNNQAMKMRVEDSLKNNRGMPDEVLMKCISERMKQSDCVVNGWVMDGFPSSTD